MSELKTIVELLVSEFGHQIKGDEELGFALLTGEPGLTFDDKNTHREFPEEVKHIVGLDDKAFDTVGGTAKSEFW